MSGTPAGNTTQSPDRMRDIDLWKGIGCLLMALAHPLRFQVVLEEAGGAPMPFFAQWIVLNMEPGAVVFFMASGVNVLTFVKRNLGREDFAATRFYLLSAILLFFMGLSYSLALGTMRLGVPDIFQGIAMGMILTFLLLRFRASSLAMTSVALVIFLVTTLVHGAVPSTPEGFESLGVAGKFFFAHFSFFPWAGMVVLGAALYQSAQKSPSVDFVKLENSKNAGVEFSPNFMDKTNSMKFAAASMARVQAVLKAACHGATQRGELFMGLAAVVVLILSAGFFPPPPILDHHEMLLRTSGPYLASSVSAGVILMILVRRLYKGPQGYRLPRLLEFAGVESFLFLVHHFAVLFFLVIVGAGWMSLYLRALATLLITFATLRPVADLRNRMAAKPGFLKKALGVFALSFGLAFLLMMKDRVPASMLVAFPATYAFTFSYPLLRKKMRETMSVAKIRAPDRS